MRKGFRISEHFFLLNEVTVSTLSQHSPIFKALNRADIFIKFRFKISTKSKLNISCLVAYSLVTYVSGEVHKFIFSFQDWWSNTRQKNWTPWKVTRCSRAEHQHWTEWTQRYTKGSYWYTQDVYYPYRVCSIVQCIDKYITLIEYIVQYNVSTWKLLSFWNPMSKIHQSLVKNPP